MSRRKPTREEVEAAAGKTVPDVIGPGLSLLFCGINPGLYTAAVGHHFGRPGNRFWRTLHAAGFTDRILDPSEDRSLLREGYGITNLVSRATARAEELTAAELVRGRRSLERKVRRYAPRAVAVLGIGAFRSAFERPKPKLGLQPETLAGAMLWLLPNPSGLNAHHQAVALAGKFRELREAVEPDSDLTTIARLATEAGEGTGGVPHLVQDRRVRPLHPDDLHRPGSSRKRVGIEQGIRRFCSARRSGRSPGYTPEAPNGHDGP